MIGWQVLALAPKPESWRETVGCLSSHGFRLTTVTQMAEFWRRIHRSAIDLVLFDLDVPDDDGLDLLHRLCGQWDVPVIVVGGDGGYSCITALELGADDYVRRPIAPLELIARIRALHRRLVRTGETAVAFYRFLDIGYASARHQLVSANGITQRLTSGEDRLLRAFLDAPRRLLSRERLLQRMHGALKDATDRSVDILVSRLRRKLAAVAGPQPIIQTERSSGYMFVHEVHIELATSSADRMLR